MQDKSKNNKAQKELNRGGRPPKITNVILRKLETAFRMGSTDREAVIYANISSSTLYDFQKKNPRFTEQKEGWKLCPILKARKMICDNIKKNVGIAKWYLERKCRTEFATRQAISLSEPNTELSSERIKIINDILGNDNEELFSEKIS